MYSFQARFTHSSCIVKAANDNRSAIHLDEGNFFWHSAAKVDRAPVGNCLCSTLTEGKLFQTLGRAR